MATHPGVSPLSARKTALPEGLINLIEWRKLHKQPKSIILEQILIKSLSGLFLALRPDDSQGMDSFLSLVLKRLVCETGVSEAVVPDALTPEGLVNWKAVARCLPAEEQEHGDAPAYFMHCARALAPWFNTAHRHHGRLSQNDSVRFLQVFEKHTQWTSSPSCALRLARELPQCAGCGERVLEWFLLYFPLLERSLGDVFLCRGRQCPSLLKDLLLTTELRTLLSVTAMRLLRVLIGPPISLNLRNVLWHGFPKPGEIPEQYAWVMFCLLPSLGKLLEENGLQPSEIPHRDFLSLSPFQSDHVIFSELDTADYSDLIERSELIPAEMKALWRLSVVRFESAQFGACASILLPQLEHVLRLLFAEQNGCAERVRTAETAEFFTTFDEMLVKVLPDGAENQLLRALTPGLLHLLLDLLHHPEGPRVRDRLSHGEVDADQVPEQVAQSVIAACCALLSLNCGPQAVARSDSLLCIRPIRANSNANHLILLACSVNTPIHAHRFHLFCVALCVLCG